MTGTAVVVEQETAVAVTPMQMLQMAVSKGTDLDQLTKLMDLQERWEKNEARKAYHAAFATFKSEAVAVVKRIDIKDGPLKGKKYADLAAAVDAATPMLSKHGLSASWKITKDEKDWIEATCTLTHSAGHSESTSFGGPPDQGGAKNSIQARASTLNYCERYSFLAVCGLAAKGADDDANAVVKVMPESQRVDFETAIDALTDVEAWKKLWDQITAASTKAGDVATHEHLRGLMAAKRKAITTKEKAA